MNISVIIYQTQKLGLQRFVVKTTPKSDHLWSAIFSVIVCYSKSSDYLSSTVLISLHVLLMLSILPAQCCNQMLFTTQPCLFQTGLCFLCLHSIVPLAQIRSVQQYSLLAALCYVMLCYAMLCSCSVKIYNPRSNKAKK